MKAGDLVKMNRGFSPPGLVIKVRCFEGGRFANAPKHPYESVHIEWPDGRSIERNYDLEVINESS